MPLRNKITIFISSLLILIGCIEEPTTVITTTVQNNLPIFGVKEFIPEIDKDTIYHTIPFWSFTNQDGLQVTSEDYSGKPYIAYFFFSTCPQICPKINSNMIQFQEDTKGIDYNVIAYTVDPKTDSVARLKEYATQYGFDLSHYNFVTGYQKDIYELGVKGYLVPNSEDALAPGGFLHSEKLMLIDSKKRIRGFYEGTESTELQRLKKDLQLLIELESNEHK